MAKWCGSRTLGRVERVSGPYLIIAALWQDEDTGPQVAKTLSRLRFPPPSGYPEGFAVAFEYEEADAPQFRRYLERLHLGELNARPDKSD